MNDYIYYQNIELLHDLKYSDHIDMINFLCDYFLSSLSDTELQ